MDSTPAVTSAVGWQITQQTVRGEAQTPQVRTNGRVYERQSASSSDASKLVNLVRQSSGVGKSDSSTEVVARLSSDKILYKQFTYSSSGILQAMVQRVIPLGLLSNDVHTLLNQVDLQHQGVEDLQATQSLHLQPKKQVPIASYSMYISVSHGLMAQAKRLVKLLESFEHDWGLHAIFLPDSPDLGSEQIRNAIHKADLFVALVDADYATMGSRTQTELRIASELAPHKSQPWISSVFFDNFTGEGSEILSNGIALFLYGKSPKDFIERMANFMLSLLLRKRKREQATSTP